MVYLDDIDIQQKINERRLKKEKEWGESQLGEKKKHGKKDKQPASSN